MTENQLYMSFRNEQTLSANPCGCASQDIVFDLERYGPYLDQIRALFVPSLEYRVRSLLEEFVYNTNSRWAKQFPCFKKFVDAIVMWKNSLNRIAEYDIGTMEKMMRHTVKRMIKDDLISYFLDSIILHHRLNKVCRELDAMGIEDNILRNLNVWNFINERDYLLDRNCFTDFNTITDCNINLNTVMPCNSEGSTRCKEAVKLLTKNVCDRSTEHMQPTTSEYREYRRTLDQNQNLLQRRKDNPNHYSICVTTGSQNDSTNKTNRFFNEKSCNTQSKTIQNGLKLKIIVHKTYLENYEYSTFSSSNVTRLPLPCKPSNLIRRIFEADPSLAESCLIVMKRKFEDSMYNVCSCLNSILEKLNFKLTKALCLYCEIYPGHIIFKLKASNIKKCLFVARVPICQNVRKRTIQQDFIILSSNSKPSIEINESKCFEQCKDNNTNFNNTLGCIDEENGKFDTRCSRSDPSFIKDMLIDMSQNKAETSNEKNITCMITENVSRYVQNLATCSCNNSCKDIVEEISDMISCVDNSEERNGEYCKVLNSSEINCDNVENWREKILKSSESIIKNDTSTQLVKNVNCMCSSCENFIEANNEIENIFSKKDSDSLSQTTSTNEHDWTCSSNKNLEHEVCNTNTYSITSFVQNSEYDKQLVELNCNHFSNNNIKAIDMKENDSSLNSAKVEIGCNSCCSCQRDDFIDITVINDTSKENIICTFETSQENFDAAKARSADYSKTVQISSRSNNLLTISVQMPRSKVLSKGIDVEKCYSRAVCLTSDDDREVSTTMETSDRCNKIANPSTHTLIFSKKRSKIFPDINKEVFDVRDGTQDFIISPERFSASKERFRSNGDSRSSGFSTGEYLRAENHSMCATSNASLYCRSFATTSEFVMSDRRDKFQKSVKSETLSKLREHICARSRNDIRNVTSTTIKHRTTSRKYPNDYPAEIRSQTILAMIKFRNSVDKIKHLICTKLGRILFNNKISSNNKITKTFWRNKESSEDTRRKKTSDKYIRQDYSITSCSTCDCCRRGYTTSSRESSNMILSIRRTKGKKRSKENIKFRDHKLADSSEALLSFRSIKTSPWSYNLLTSTTEDIEKQKLNRNNRPRYNRKKDIINVMNNSRDFKNSKTSITISSQSTKISLTKRDSKYFGHYRCKRQEETCDNKRICKQVRQEYKRYGNKNKYRDHAPIKYSNINSNESLKTSLSHIRRENARNVQKQFYGISKLRNVKRFASSRKNRQIFEKDMSDRSDNEDLHKRHVFAILTDACNDYMDDLDLDFKLRLLRYVELCKSIKRSLMRTLRSDDIYEVSTASMPDSERI